VSVQNVLIGRDGVARLSDFGVAKSAMASQQTAHNALVGKLLYMPPEYLQRADVDRRLDVYAMGLTLWIALAGVEPWGDDDDVALVGRILREELPLLASVGANVAPELERIVRKACAKDPVQRYATAAEMSAELTQLTRRTGWMAVHEEVAAFVQASCGRDLARVREQVARVSSWPPERVSDVVPSDARRWSAVGAQKIRVLPRSPNAVDTESETQLEAPAPAAAPSAEVGQPQALEGPGLERRARVRLVAHTLLAVALVLAVVLFLIALAS
jgi:serine/threonine-protein kinase